MEGTDGIMEGTGMNWRKSSHSGNGGGDCIEVASTTRVHVRDSKDKDGVKLGFTTAAWTAFTAQLKRSLGTSQPSL